MAKVDYLQFKGIVDAGEYNDFAIFKDGYNVAFDIENRISLPPEFEKVRGYDVQVLKYEKMKSSLFRDGKEIDVCLGYKNGDYFLFLNDEKVKFSTKVLATARTISQQQANSYGFNLLSLQNEKKLFFINPNSNFRSIANSMIWNRGYFYLYFDNGDEYLNKFLICDGIEGVEGNPEIFILRLAGQGVFRRYLRNQYNVLTQGYPQSELNLYDKNVHILDCNLFDYINKEMHNEVVDYKFYSFLDGISIHKIWGNYSTGKPSNLVYYDKNTNHISQKKGVYNFNPNFEANYDDTTKTNPYILLNLVNDIKQSTGFLSGLDFLYAYAFTAVLVNGEEIPLLTGMFYKDIWNATPVKLHHKVFYLDKYGSIYVSNNPLLFGVYSLSYEYLPLMIEKINIYVAQVYDYANYAGEYGVGWAVVRYFDAEKVPDSMFVLRGYIDLRNNNQVVKIDSDITLAELPTFGSRWLVKLRDETIYGSNLVIGLGDRNLIYESVSLAEGEMIDIIPEENFTTLNIVGNIEKLLTYEYKLFAFTNEQLFVIDPERDYQVVNKFDIGLIDRKAIATTPNGIVFVSSDGNVYLTDGVRLEELSVAFREKLRRFIRMINFVAYNPARNEVLFSCGRVVYVYHFLINRWSIYATSTPFVDYSQFKELYLVNAKGEIVRLNYTVRTNNKEKVILMTYKNDFGIKEPKLLKSITLDCLGIVYVVVITDRFVSGYKFEYPHMKIAMPPVVFNHLQLVFWSDDYRFDIKRIEVEFDTVKIDHERSLRSSVLDGVLLDCNNEFVGLSKNNLVRYPRYSQNYDLLDIDVSCVYDSVFKRYRKGNQEVLDFDYLYEYIRQLGCKKVLLNTRVFWTSFNNLNSTDDENFDPYTAPIYNNPVVPYVNNANRMPYITPQVSYKYLQLGRGGATGWEFHASDINGHKIYKLVGLDKCYWVFYDSSNYARNNIGQWQPFVKYETYQALRDGNDWGWYYDYDNRILYVKLASNVNINLENISIVIDNPLNWKASDGVFWNYTQNPTQHFRVPHPWVSGTISDDELVKIIRFFKEKGYKVGFHSELFVVNSIGIGHRRYIKVWDSLIANDYASWIKHYVKLFKDNNVKPDLFWVGSEMTRLEINTNFNQTLQSLIGYIKSELPGVKVVYSLNMTSLWGLFYGNTACSDFITRVIQNLDYIGVNFYPPLLGLGEYHYNPHLYLRGFQSDILKFLRQTYGKKLIVVFGVGSVKGSLYDPGNPNPPYSDGTIDELAQFAGIYALLMYLNKLKNEDVVEDFYLSKLDVRPFPVYPDAFEFKQNYEYYYNDNAEYAVSEQFINKLVWYLIKDV